MRKLPIKLKSFLIITYLFTFISLYILSSNNYTEILSTYKEDIIFFSILIALTESITVSFRNMSFSTSFAIQIASFILFGPLATILIIIIGFTFRIIKVDNKYKHILNTPFYGTLFNYCVLVLPIIYGSYFYSIVGGISPEEEIFNKLFPIMLFGIICFFVNTFVISILFSIKTNKNIFYSFLSNIRLGFLNIVVMVPFGIILVIIFKENSYLGVILVLFPIILARYTFSLYIDSKTQYIQTVDAIMKAIEARDKYTEGHSERVAEISTMIARELKYSEFKIEQLNMAALLHDVGKIGINDSILKKPGKLTKEEFDIIKSHSEIGDHIIKDIKNLDYARAIVRHHHERYDGKGYPDGKKAEELDLEVFIIQLADSIDAMATDRPYRKALSNEEIIEEIKKNTGSQFHPEVVDAYFRATEKKAKS